MLRQSRHSLSGSWAQGLTRLPSRGQCDWYLICRLDGDRIHFSIGFVSLQKWDWGLLCTAGCVLEALCISLAWGLPSQGCSLDWASKESPVTTLGRMGTCEFKGVWGALISEILEMFYSSWVELHASVYLMRIEQGVHCQCVHPSLCVFSLVYLCL